MRATEPRADDESLSPQLKVDLLPVELLIELLRPLTTNDLARVDQVSHAFHSAPQATQLATERPQSVVEQALRRRAAEGGHAVPEALGGEATWQQLLLWQERRRRWGTQQVVECGAHHRVFVDASGGVLTCGSERFFPGVLGHGTLTGEHKVVALPTVVPGLKGVRVVSVAASPVYTIALTESGLLYTWGMGERGSLGHGNERDIHTPKLVEALQAMRVVGVAASVKYGLARTDAGRLFQWGALGNRAISAEIASADPNCLLVPTLVTALQAVKVVDMEAGSSFSLALSDAGRVYSWGYGADGRLGHGSPAHQLTAPTMIEALEPHKIVSVKGCDHCLAISDAGRVFSWGAGDNGCLGHGNEEEQLTPKLIEALQEVNVVVVEAGLTHSIAVTEDGQTYSWGSGKNGALGHGNTVADSQFTPKRIEALQGLWVVGAKADNQCSLAVTATGKVYGWGRYLEGEYEPGVSLPQLYPSLQL